MGYVISTQGIYMAKKLKARKKTSAKRKSPAKKTKKLSKKKTKKKVLTQPKGYHSITPYLIVEDAANAIVFYKDAFGAKEVMRMEHSGKVGHAELKIGDAKIMLADEWPEMNAHGPRQYGGSAVSIHLYVKDVDRIIEKAVSLGAILERPVENMFYGDRSGILQDPYGHHWCVSTHIEDVSPAETRKRAAALFNK